MKTLSPEPVPLMDVVEDFLKGEIVIPQFQRDFVWSINDVKDLIDSIYNHYPIGSIMLWEEERKLDYIKEIGNIKCKESTKPIIDYILDGQQRIASIVAAIKGTEIKNKKYNIFFDLDNKIFVTENERDLEKGKYPIEQISEWTNRYIFLPDLLDGDKLFETLEKAKDILNERRKNSLREVYHRFNDYNLSIIKIKQMSMDNICKIFERINTKGKTLTVVDLMIARTSQNFDLRNKLKEYRKKLVESKFDEKLPGQDDNKGINNKNILQAISAHITGKCHREDILSLTADDLKNHWDSSINAINLAIDFIKREMNIKNARILPFSLLVVPLSYFFLKNNSTNNQQRQILKKWFWEASLSNRYDSGIDTKIAEDIKQFKKIINGEKPLFDYYYEFNYNKILNQKLSIGSAFCKTLLSLFVYLKPSDLKDNSEIDLNGVFSKYNSKEMHHIFPKNYLKKKGYENEMIDNVNNICFLPFKQNRNLSNKAPKEYLTELETENEEGLSQALNSHLININKLKEENYEDFIESRAKLIEQKLKNLVGLEEDTINSLVTHDFPFSNISSFRKVLESCNEYIYWIDKYFSLKGLDYFLKFVFLERISKIRILMASDKFNESFKYLFNKFSQEMKNQGIVCELGVMNNSELKSMVHDRFIITKDLAYNIPSPDVLARGQLSEISESQNRKRLLEEFKTLWEKSEKC